MDVKFYYVNANYIEFLKKYEYNIRNFNSVPNVEYANNNKFFYGTVLKKNGINYYVPISHDINSSPNSIVMLTKPRRTKDKPFKLGTLKFLYMIPVHSIWKLGAVICGFAVVYLPTAYIIDRKLIK